MTNHKVENGSWEVSDPSKLVRDPRVSVVMLAYNHERYIEQAIESVLTQRPAPPFELIIGEDNSTDRTRELVLDYQDRHPHVIKVVTADRNVGMFENHERVVRACRGEYLAMLEGDDFWNSPDKLQQQAEFLDEHPACGAVHSEYSFTATYGGTWRRIPAYRRRMGLGAPSGQIYEAMLGRNLLQTCTVMLRKSFVLAYLDSGLPIQSYAVGDWPLFLFAARHSEIGYLDAPLATYRRTPGSVMNQGFGAEVIRHESYLRMLRDFCDRFETSDEAEQDARRTLTRGLAHFAIRAGDLERARAAVALLESEFPDRGDSSQRMYAYLASHPLAATGYRAGCTVKAAAKDLVAFLRPKM